MNYRQEVSRLATGHVPVVMSTEAWLEYEVPGSPFFVLVDGASGSTVGQGVAPHVEQLLDLIRRAEHDRGRHFGSESQTARPQERARARSGRRRSVADGRICPGDPSLYPQTLKDVFPFDAGSTDQFERRIVGPS